MIHAKKYVSFFEKKKGSVINTYLEYSTNQTMINKKAMYFSIIELQNTWNHICKNIIIDSYKYGIILLDSALINLVSSSTDPFSLLQTNWSRKPKPNDWEPNWYTPTEAIKACSILHINNESQIIAGLGALTVSDDIRISRNLLAHDLEKMHIEFKQMSLSKYRISCNKVDELISNYYPGTYITILDYWINEYRNVLISILS